ncbi:LLM class flavin-dependent oxidoreductase [Nocardia fluminea]|uniref:LLM class flavin-dependent oxidoreductase n=1 Tax=Nocardia fluminea TaxID=134984 RepID=UPI003719BCFB
MKIISVASTPWNPSARPASTTDMALESVRFSILDRSRVRRGQGHAEALRETVAFAVPAEQWGFHRFWVAEHHSLALSGCGVGSRRQSLPNHFCSQNKAAGPAIHSTV